MKLETVDLESRQTWRRIRRRLKGARDWLDGGDNPYSALLSLSLLLVVGVVAKTWH
jgi:hypothetical protein